MPDPFDDLDIEFEEESSRPSARRTVLDPVDVVGAADGTGTSTMGEGGRVVIDGPVDKGPAQRPDYQRGMELEDAARARDTRSQQIAAADEASRRGGFLGSILDATGLGGEGSMRRTGERAHQLWDQLTSSDARLGGRNTIDPIVGEDLRGEAGAAGVTDTALLGFGDEAAGAASALAGGDYTETRDRARQRAHRAAEQAPGLHAIGQVAGTAPLMALPGASSTSAGPLMRLAMGAGQGAQLGGMAAFGGSEADLVGEDANPTRLATDTGIGAAIGGGAGLLGQLGGDAAAHLTNPQAMRRAADASQRFADRARLEASGVWGDRATRAANELPGGQERLAQTLRRYHIGQGNGILPRAERAIGEAETLRRAAGSTLEQLAQTADDAGVRIPAQGVIDAAESSAQQLERLGTRTAQQAAQRLRQEVAPMTARPEMSFSDAWQLRRFFDEMADFAPRSSDDALRTSGAQFTRLRQAVDGLMDQEASRVGIGSQWTDANRLYGDMAFLRQHGGGADRLSVGGGIGGANGTGEVFANALMSGNPLQLATAPLAAAATRAGAQESRMLFPGLRAVGAETGAALRRTLADAIGQSAERGGLASYLQAGGEGARVAGGLSSRLAPLLTSPSHAPDAAPREPSTEFEEPSMDEPEAMAAGEEDPWADLDLEYEEEPNQ